MSDMTDETQTKLKALGYSVVDASNPVVECGWLMRAPGVDDRAWIAASEAEAWQMAHHHHSQARTNNTDGAALLPVAQRDRDAAAPFANCLSDMQDIFDGKADGLPVVQAFARHRIATQEDAERSGAGMDSLRAHFTRMMEAAANYLEPTTYVARHPQHGLTGPCRFTTEFPMPDENHSDSAKADINGRRDQAFIRDMIYMLDGPEQRAALAHPAQATPSAPDEGFDKDWCVNMAKKEAGYAIGAGELAIDPFTPSAVSGEAGEPK